jgi:hypothetical protein
VFDPVVVEEVGAAKGMCALEWEGVGGPDEDGDNGSVTQSLVSLVSRSITSLSYLTYRCDLVATSLATVCASVEVGFTWKTGNESLPSINPRVDKITEMKCVQVF